MNAPGKILLFFCATILFGCVLAPPLYWAGQALAAQGVLRFLGATDFQKFFNRAMLVAAVLLLWPTVRWLGVGGRRDFGLQPDVHWRQHLAIGFGVAAIAVGAMAAAYIAGGVYRWKSELPWSQLPKLALSATVVSILEETLFRGAIFGLFRKTLSARGALFWVTAIFAILHFLKPDDDAVVGTVTWSSGFALLPHTFHQFAEPATLLAGFTTLFVLGWILGDATLRTGALWMSIGFHAGVVFVKMGFSKFTKRQEEFLPWIGPELQIGLVPVGVLILAGIALRLWLQYEDRAILPPRR